MAELPATTNDCAFPGFNLNANYPGFEYFDQQNAGMFRQQQAFFGQQFNPYRQATNYGLFEYHEPISPAASSLRCQKCGYAVESYAQLGDHDSLYHCGTGFYNPVEEQQMYAFDESQLLTPPLSPIRCERCGCVAESAARLAQHHCVLDNAPAKNEKLYRCDLCGKTFKRIGFFKRHVDLHGNPLHRELVNSEVSSTTDERPQWIPDRARPQMTPANLSAESKCLICDRVFSGPCYLIQHNNIRHAGEKLHKCRICGKKFAERDALLNHTKKHEGDKPHKCSVCPKSYHHNCDLVRHMFGAHMAKEFHHSCGFCGKKFIRKDHLNRHVERHTRVLC